MAEKKLKIAFLSFYSGSVYRGVEIFVHELANRLTRLGVEVTVYQNNKNNLKNPLYKTVAVNIPANSNAKSSYMPFTNYYARKVKKFTHKVLNQIDSDTDIVFPTNGQWQVILCRLWALRKRKKIIVSGQSGPGLDDKINIFTFPTRFIALTNHQKKWAKKTNPFVKAQTIPNGVDTKKFRKNNSKKTKNHTILCVAALQPWKRLDLAINATSRVKNASLIIVGGSSGEPEYEKKLLKLGKEKLKDKFKIVSYPHHKMPEVYKRANVFTYPTVPWESFGIVLIEALAAGLPVVATDDPIRREIIGNAGIFTDPTDPEKYSNALQKALNKEWGSVPKKQAKKFDWDNIAEKYKNLFQSL